MDLREYIRVSSLINMKSLLFIDSKFTYAQALEYTRSLEERERQERIKDQKEEILAVSF